MGVAVDAARDEQAPGAVDDLLARDGLDGADLDDEVVGDPDVREPTPGRADNGPSTEQRSS